MLDAVVRTGVVVDEEIVDLTDPAIGLPGDLVALLALGPDAGDALATASSTRARRVAMATMPRPPSFLGIGRNYAAHIDELGHERSQLQTWFSKQPTCVIGPGAAIEVPPVSSAVDYEDELGMVVGRRCRHVPADRALEVVARYTVVNDVQREGLAVAHPDHDDGQGR